MRAMTISIALVQIVSKYQNQYKKTSKSSIFCTDFIIFPILAKISSYKRSKSTVFVFFLAKNGVFNTNRTPGATDPHAGVCRRVLIFS